MSVFSLIHAAVLEMVDKADLKSVDILSCRFESGQRHHLYF